MLIVGELINTSRKSIMESVELRNAEYIRDIAKKQAEAGANYLDINCGSALGKEPEVMRWLVEQVRAAVNVPLCIDTSDAATMEVGLSLADKGQPMANSISGEEERYRKMMSLVIKYRPKIIALCMDKQGVPESAQDRLRVARRLVKDMTGSGVDIGDIYLDPVLKPLSTGDNAGLELLDAIRLIKREFPGVHLVCGLSNISYGLPNRKILNQTLMIQNMTVGMDAFILDPLDRQLMGYFYASRALVGQDAYCREYLAAHRRGLYQR